MTRTLIERLHDDGQEEEQWLIKKRFENFCIMMPIYLWFWVSGEMIITTSTLRWSNCIPFENQVYIVPTSFMIHKLR